MNAVTSHYDEEYFAWQVKVGTFGGWANKIKFGQTVRPTDTVLDFGCGGGFLLQALDCAKRIGVEINPVARETARRNGVLIYASTAEVPDASVDIIISNHALEHTHRPLDELKALLTKLKPGGKLCIVVPCETIKMAWRPDDGHQHLYTWAPNNLGNILGLAGFAVDRVEPFIHRWPPHYERIAKLGPTLFHLACMVYARWNTQHFQVRAFAHRPVTKS